MCLIYPNRSPFLKGRMNVNFENVNLLSVTWSSLSSNAFTSGRKPMFGQEHGLADLLYGNNADLVHGDIQTWIIGWVLEG